MILKKLLIIFVCYCCVSCENDHSKKEQKIIAIAQKEWIKIFHSDFEEFQPFKVELKDSTWIISGTLNWNKDGGVPTAIIDTFDLSIIEVYHTK